MREIYEFRIFKDYYHLLSQPNCAIFNGFVYVLQVEKDNPVFQEIGELDKKIRGDGGEALFASWRVVREYTRRELDEARLFHIKIATVFEPAGEECGTEYDEDAACDICGANRVQLSSLILKKGSIPNKDIARTIAGEVVVSENFVESARRRDLTGLELQPVQYADGKSRHFQLLATEEVRLTDQGVAGVDPFDLSTSSPGREFTVSGGHKIRFDAEVYRCPKGHTIGLNLLSEAFVADDAAIRTCDFLASRQKVGVKRGLLRPEPQYFCSQAFRRMVVEEKLNGFQFEVAHVQ